MILRLFKKIEFGVFGNGTDERLPDNKEMMDKINELVEKVNKLEEEIERLKVM